MNPTNESIGRAFLEHEANGIGPWRHVHASIINRARELDRQAPGGEAKWPDHVMLRDTKLHDDQGGLGQRIFTTAGAGYEKVKYVRADLAAAPQPPAQEQGEVGEHVLILEMILTSYGDKPLTFTSEKAALKAAITCLTRAAGAEDARDAERMREALSDLLSWFPDAAAPAEWRLRAGSCGADDAIAAARAAIASQAQEGGGEVEL